LSILAGQQHVAQQFMSPDFFNQLAQHHDDPARRYQVFCADQITTTLTPLHDQRVLDLACGTGAAAISIAKQLPQGRVHAVDFAEVMLDALFEKCQHLKINNIDLHEMDAQQLAFRSDYFDIIVCHYALPLMAQPTLVLNEIQRVLKPSGKAIFSLLSKQALQPCLDWLYQQLQVWGINYQDSMYQNQQHYQSIPQTQQNLIAAGFKHSKHITRQVGYHLQTPEDCWHILWNSPERRHLSHLSATEHSDFKNQYLETVQKFWEKGGEKQRWLDVETHLIAAYLSDA